MNAPLLIGAALLAIALIASWRTWRLRRSGRIWRIAAQFVLAALLYLVFHPPQRPLADQMLVVLTPGITVTQRDMLDPSIRTVSLPGVVPAASAESVPDLATALRRYPAIRRIHVVGAGLPARDRDVARSRVVSMDFSTAPAGISELHAPAELKAGSTWRVHGRVDGITEGNVELLDRAGRIVSRSALDAAGRFNVDAAVRTAGISRFVIRALAADEQVVEEMPVEVVVHAGDALRVLLIAGAVDAELKYLRRWAVDAGVELGVRMAISRGIALRDGVARIDAESLGKSDLLIADERSWAAMSAIEKDAVQEAAQQGLGVLLRVTGPIPTSVRKEWEALGFQVEAAEIGRAVMLPTLAAGPDETVELARRPVAVAADDAAPLLVAGDGTALASWRAHGRGRIGVWWLEESYRLVLAGNAARFGMLWSEALRTLARANAPSPPSLRERAWIDQRAVVCGVGEEAMIESPDRVRTALRNDPLTPGCAAFWPTQAGWHRIVEGESHTNIRVHDPLQAPALAHADTVQSTRRVALGAREPPLAVATAAAPRWPFFLAWLLVAATVWWSERRTVAETDAPESS